MFRSKAMWLSVALSSICFPMAFFSKPIFPLWIGSFIIWFAYAPLIYALRNASPRMSFRAGFGFGFFSHILILYWIGIAISKYGGVPISASFLVLLLLVIKQGLFWGVGFWALARMRHQAPLWLTGMLLFTLLEWVHTYFPFQGFPWCAPGYALSGALSLIQIGDVTGMVGLNGLIFLCNFLMAEGLLAKRGDVSFPRVGVATFLILFTGSLFYGVWRLSTPLENSKAKTLRVALVQGNISQDQKWLPELQDRILDTYLQLTRQATEAGADLVIWPEAALPIMLYQDTTDLSFLASSKQERDLLLGAITWGPSGMVRSVWNSAWLVDNSGKAKAWYGKQHLVPFGEYVPLASVLPIRKIVPTTAGNFESGISQPPLPETHGHPFGILICYESLFPDLTIDYVRRGAEFLANITNDAWFDRTSGPYQHLEFGRFRAIESRRAFVRAANTGISTWFDPLGHQHQATTLFRRDIITTDIPLNKQMTFYVRHPHLFPGILTFLFLIMNLGAFANPVKHSEREEHVET